MTIATKQLGIAGEQQIQTYLKNEGFSIRACNYRQSFGEVDIIAQKKDLLVFVEVKARSNAQFDLSEVITRSKQRKIILCAHHYISTHELYDVDARFDVALLDGTTITYIPNAFQEGL